MHRRNTGGNIINLFKRFGRPSSSQISAKYRGGPRVLQPSVRNTVDHVGKLSVLDEGGQGGEGPGGGDRGAGGGERRQLGTPEVAYLRNEVSREERWSAMALIGRFEPFGFSEISEGRGRGLMGLVGGRVAFIKGFLVATFFWNCF